MESIGAEEASCIPASISETEIATPNQITPFEKKTSTIFHVLPTLKVDSIINFKYIFIFYFLTIKLLCFKMSLINRKVQELPVRI